MRRRARARAALVPGAVLVWACAYYNGLYNANHLAADAARASREGRPGEARSLWEQAALKAESVAVRHPRSRYRDAALVLQGESLRDAGACGKAVRPLALVADSGRREEDRERAALALGACYVQLGEPGRARLALTPLVTTGDSGVQAPARLWRARAALAEGDATSALADLDGLRMPDAAFERAGALAVLGRGDEAVAALSAAAAAPFSEPRWQTTLGVLGRSHPGLASQLAEQVAGRPDVSAGARARVLAADADRWAATGDEARALGLLALAARAAPDSADGRTAAARLAVARLRTAATREDVAAVTADLSRAMEDGGQAARVADGALGVLRRITAARESSAPDLRLFLAAETVRDVLRAAPLAEFLFLEIARDHPASAVAPKALLAAAQLGSARAESLLAVVASRYPDSPYWLATRGGNPAAYPAVEDSLRAFAAREAPAEVTRPRPGARLVPTEEEIRRPTSPPSPQPGRRIPEP